jgi:hypothetical protein
MNRKEAWKYLRGLIQRCNIRPMTEEDFAQEVAKALKRRQSLITHIKRVVVEMPGTLYDTTAATMAIHFL